MQFLLDYGASAGCIGAEGNTYVFLFSFFVHCTFFGVSYVTNISSAREPYS